jgi:hypothetical protein
LLSQPSAPAGSVLEPAGAVPWAGERAYKECEPDPPLSGPAHQGASNTMIASSRPRINNSCVNVRRIIRETLKPNPCRHCCAVLRSSADSARVLVASLPCKRRNCTICHPYWVGSWLLPDLDRFAEHATGLHAWRGPQGQLRAVTVRCRRAGVHYRWIRLADGTALVIASGEFPGGRKRTLDWCAESEAIALENAAPVRTPASGCQAWGKPRRERSGKWEALAVGVGASPAAAVKALEDAGAKVKGRHESKAASAVLLRFAGMGDEDIRKACVCAVVLIRPEWPQRPPYRLPNYPNQRLKPNPPAFPIGAVSSRDNSAHGAERGAA